MNETEKSHIPSTLSENFFAGSGVTHMCVRQGNELCSFLSKDKNCARLKWDHDKSKKKFLELD
jgi:hypothetical protein